MALAELEDRHGHRAVERGVERDGDDHETSPFRRSTVRPATQRAFCERGDGLCAPRRAATGRRSVPVADDDGAEALARPDRQRRDRGRDDALDETPVGWWAHAARRDERERRLSPADRDERVRPVAVDDERGPVAGEAEAQQRGEVGVALRLARRAEHRSGDPDAARAGERDLRPPRLRRVPGLAADEPGDRPEQVVRGHDCATVGQCRAALADVPLDDRDAEGGTEELRRVGGRGDVARRVEAVRVRVVRAVEAELACGAVHRGDEARQCPARCDGERRRGVVRTRNESADHEVAHGDALPRTEPDVDSPTRAATAGTTTSSSSARRRSATSTVMSFVMLAIARGVRAAGGERLSVDGALDDERLGLDGGSGRECRPGEIKGGSGDGCYCEETPALHAASG